MFNKSDRLVRRPMTFYVYIQVLLVTMADL
jgi:hypothetical protein